MGRPIILHANHFQFAAGQELENPCVGSRMLLWCRQGQGAVEVDGQRRSLAVDDWLLLPWRHRVVYRADRRRPFLVGGIHLCPDHDPAAPVELRVPHLREDPLHAAIQRRDARWMGLDGLPGGSLDERPRLRLLAAYIAERWATGAVDLAAAWAMGGLLADELRATVGSPEAAALPLPLATALRAVRAAPQAAHELAALAATAGCSPATLVRLFRAHLNVAPMAWVRAERIDRARRLLATTALPIAEVALRCGVPDPRRFAKLFRAATGQTPRAWRQRARL